MKSLLRQRLSNPIFYGDLVYKWKKVIGSYNLSAQLIKIISHFITCSCLNVFKTAGELDEKVKEIVFEGI